jgi:phenylacetaldehyde dehydrogenase
MAAAVDIPSAILQIRYMAEWATKLGGETPTPMAAPIGTFHSYTAREPIGVGAKATTISRSNGFSS